jgi:hypothetical protein
MYILGGNDVVDTFEDLWKIPLQDVINHVKIASGETDTLELNEDDRKGPEFRSPKWECLHRHCYAKGGIHRYTYMYMHICIDIFYLYVNIFIFVSIHSCKYIHTYMHTYKLTYIHLYKHMNEYTCTLIHIHRSLSGDRP